MLPIKLRRLHDNQDITGGRLKTHDVIDFASKIAYGGAKTDTEEMSREVSVAMKHLLRSFARRLSRRRSTRMIGDTTSGRGTEAMR